MGHGRFPMLADGAFQIFGLFKSADGNADALDFSPKKFYYQTTIR